MTRTISLASVLFIAALWVPASAQTPASSGKVADDKAESNTTLPTNKSGGRTLADYVQDSSTEPVEMTVAGIEKVLKDTHGVTVRFNGHQVSMPVVGDVPHDKIAEHILSQTKSIPGLQLYAGRTGLLISTESNLGSAMSLSLAKVMFIEPGQREKVTNPPADSSINAADGRPATQLSPGDLLKQGLLDKAESISVMLGEYNIVLPLSDKSPRRAIAEAMEKLRGGKHSYSLLDGRNRLYVMTEVEGLEPLLSSFIGILNTAGDPPHIPDARTKAGGGISISVPAVGPEPIGVDFGGGGFGGIEPPLPRQAIPSKNFSVGKNFVIAIAEKGDRAWGYSKNLGKWTTLKFDAPFHGTPILGDEVACLMTGVMPSDLDQSRSIWGYSPITGGWDKLTLPAKSKAIPNIVADMIVVEDGDYMRMFSAQSGKWAAPPEPDDVAAPKVGTPIGLPGPPNLNTPGVPADKLEIKIFTLANIPAKDAAALVGQIIRHAQLSVALDARTNSLLAQGPVDILMQIEAVLIRLDEAKPANDKRTDSQALDLKFAEQASERVTRLKQDYATSEQKAAAIARNIRNATRPTDQLKSNLRQTVAEAFSLRQQLHQAELAAFQQRMAKVQQTIRTRDQLKDQIIDRRVEDLLNPNLKWDDRSTSKAPQTSTTTELEGDWSLESIKGGGVISHEQGVKVRVRGHQWITVRGDQEYPTAITVNSGISPKTIDMTTGLAGGGRTRIEKGIYRLDGDMLIISWGPNGGARPTEFDGQKYSFHTMRRIDQETAATVQVRITEPEGAMITLLEQQDNGSDVAPTNHSVPIPVRLNFSAGKVHRLRLSGIPSHGTLEPVVTVEIPVPAEAVKGFLSLNAVSINFTNEDLNQAAAGNAVIKAIYLKDPAVGSLASAGPTGLEVMVNTRTDPGVDILAEADKRGTIVAVVRILPREPLSPTSVPRGEELRKFEAPQVQVSSVVGTVQEVRENNTVVISLLEPGSARVKDVWIIERRNKDDPNTTYAFARVEVVQILNAGVLARVIESTRVLDNNKFAWQSLEAGDLVARPTYFEPATTAKAASANETAGASTGGQASTTPPDGRLILKSVEDFQQHLITVESAVNTHRQDLRQAKAALAAGTGKQAAVDACQIQVDAWGKKLVAIRAELNAQIKLLDLEAQFANKARDIARVEYQKASQANKILPGTVTNVELQRLKLIWESAALKMEQATVLLGLYQKVAPHLLEPTDTAAGDATTFVWELLGLRIQSVDMRARSLLPRFRGGLQVLEVRVDSLAAKARIMNGDILVGLGSWETCKPADAVFALRNNASPDQTIRFFVLRGDKILYGDLTHPSLNADSIAAKLSPDTPRHFTYQFRFDSVSWLVFLEWLARSTDRGGVKVGTEPKGTFSYATKQPLRLDEILDIVNLELKSQGLEVTATDTFLRVNKKGEVVPPADPMAATPAIMPDDERIWRILGLRLTPAAPSAIRQANPLYNGGLNVLAVRPDSPAAVDGKLQQGDILCGLHLWHTENIDHVMFVLNHHEFTVFQPLKFFVLRDGKTLSGHMKVGVSAPPPSELVSPPSTEEISKKNLSDLMLALHHYHDQHKHFPPAVIMGKDGKGKVPHSWRVEILPHLGEQKLYDEYHFDEAWDSEHNFKLLDRMPAVFRSPLDRPESYSTSYFALVTPGLKPQSSSGAAAGTGDANEVLRYDLGTVFSNPRGAQLLDIHDGTARTVALVESKRSVAWMQPEDIPYSADQPVPLLGGWYVDGWNAAFAEGTVKMISNQNTDATLRAIFTIGDGINALPKVVDDSGEEAGTVPPASKN